MISDIKRKTLPAISRVVGLARTTAFPYRITLERVSIERGKIKADFTSISDEILLLLMRQETEKRRHNRLC